MSHQTYTLANGLRLIHEPSHSQVVYCGYVVCAGTRHEAEADSGMAHFIEHLTFKGTSRRRACHITNGLERVGGDLNAFTTKQETVYYATAMTLSYVVGQRYYPIRYPLKDMAVYVAITLLFFAVMQAAATWIDALWLRLVINTGCIALFMAHTVHYDFPLSNLPVVGKYFKR